MALHALENKTTLLFDLDGTLVHSLPDMVYAVNHMLDALEKPRLSAEKVGSFVGKGVKQLMRYTLQESFDLPMDSIPDELFNKALSIYQTYYQTHLSTNSKPFPKVEETLTKLLERNFQLGVVTNKPYQHSLKLLNDLNLNTFFSVVIGGDMATPKPAPDLIYLAIEKLNASTNECIMIGDSDNDVEAAKNAGIPVIGFSYGYNHGKPLNPNHVNLYLNHFDELLNYLK